MRRNAFKRLAGRPGRLTILLMRDGADGVRRVQLGGRAQRIVLGGGAALAVMVLFILFDYVGTKFENARLRGQIEQTRAANAKLLDSKLLQDAQIDAMAGRVRSVSEKLARMDEIDAYIRQLTNIQPPEESFSPGMGGEDEQIVGPVFEAKAKSAAAGLIADLEDLDRRAERRQASLLALRGALSHYEGVMVSVPTIWPVRGWVSSEFGYRISPFTGEQAMHEGIDIATPEGMPIIAPANGIVTFVGVKGNYGNTIEIRHGGGIETLYGHLQASLVREGQRVRRGQRIALVGNTGRSTGPHLHYEVLFNSLPIDPRRYILY